MKLSAPIYRLKREAKILSRSESIPLHQALDRVAAKEGFGSWSLLAAKTSAVSPAAKLYAQLEPGDLLLIGARPGQGKTLLSLELAVEAMKAGRMSVFFSLEYTESDCARLLKSIGVDESQFGGQFAFDGSDRISAEHIVRRLGPGMFAVVDYLQLLDQRRETPELASQMEALRAFAKDNAVTMAFISQIDRSYDPSLRPLPDLEDVRLPNPLDLGLFDKLCFLQDGEIRFRSALR